LRCCSSGQRFFWTARAVLPSRNVSSNFSGQKIIEFQVLLVSVFRLGEAQSFSHHKAMLQLIFWHKRLYFVLATFFANFWRKYYANS
jgi:hypothetical protein